MPQDGVNKAGEDTSTVFDVIGSLGSEIAEAEELLGIREMADSVKAEVSPSRIEAISSRLAVLRDRMNDINEELRKLGN